MNEIDKGLIFNWLSTLRDDDPKLAEIDEIMRGSETDLDEPYISLKEVAKRLGYADHSMLHKLNIQRAGERLTPGGRLKYQMPKVRKYLDSPEAARVREGLRLERSKKSTSDTS